MKKTLVACGASVFALGGVATLTLAQQLQQSPYAPKVGDPPEVSNMRLVGYSDLQARSSYQPTIHKQGNRYIAYVGHHGGSGDHPKPFNPLTRAEEFNGTSIIDVTDPANPKYLKHLPGAAGGAEAGGAQMSAGVRRHKPRRARSATSSISCAPSAGRATRCGKSPIRPIR